LPYIGKIGFDGFFPIHGVKIGRFFLEEGRDDLDKLNRKLADCFSRYIPSKLGPLDKLYESGIAIEIITY